MVTNKTASKQDEQRIIELWERSVTATHDFLSQEDKETMRVEIPGFFPLVDIQLWYDQEELIGFSGRNEHSLEMLFIDPKFIGQGYGTAILQELILNHGVTLVDVNEQNPAAKKFYFKNGFSIYERSSVDDQNRPYPILHLSNNQMGIVPLRDAPFLLDRAASWFATKWDIPAETYKKSMQDCINHRETVPQWYVVINDRKEIIAGAGVIENDFHQRKDLTPNLCALYVEKEVRNQQLASFLLNFVRQDFGNMGVESLYLVTDHTNFYEKRGWQFLTYVEDENKVQKRMYTISTLL